VTNTPTREPKGLTSEKSMKTHPHSTPPCVESRMGSWSQSPTRLYREGAARTPQAKKLAHRSGSYPLSTLLKAFRQVDDPLRVRVLDENRDLEVRQSTIICVRQPDGPLAHGILLIMFFFRTRSTHWQTHADGVVVKEVAPHNYYVSRLLIQKQNQQRSDLIQIARIITKTWSIQRPQSRQIELLAQIFH
jgi:hypothetical protein